MSCLCVYVEGQACMCFNHSYLNLTWAYKDVQNGFNLVLIEEIEV